MCWSISVSVNFLFSSISLLMSACWICFLVCPVYPTSVSTRLSTSNSHDFFPNPTFPFNFCVYFHNPFHYFTSTNIYRNALQHFADLEAKNTQSGRGPRSDSDLLKWDNEANTFDDDYEGKFHVHCSSYMISFATHCRSSSAIISNIFRFFLPFCSARISIWIRIETTILWFSTNLTSWTHFFQNGFTRDHQTWWSWWRCWHVVWSASRTSTKASFFDERTHLNWITWQLDQLINVQTAEIF